jgi:hyaluronan synthase
MKTGITQNQLYYQNTSAVAKEPAAKSTLNVVKDEAPQTEPKSVSQKRKVDFIGTLVLIGTFLLMLGGTYLVYLLQPEFDLLHQERMSTVWGFAIIAVSIAFLGVKGLFFIYNIILYFRYKPVTGVANELLPTCTVIVPAYNEGPLVYHTLMSLIQSDYPAHKMQLIAIDDGSKDDTWQWILKAKNELGDRVTIHKQPKNMGKRHALYYGFNNGNGEVFVTVDSDSVVKPDTLRNLVSPMAVNKKCGAVAGNVRVLNAEGGIIPKMLNVSFVLSFEFIRSAEGALGSVFCTPGALAAYRREAVFACLPEWINQTFMGKRSDIGEDRAMTNMIMKQGYNINFQSNAYVLTNVPEKYKGLYKMFIRWGRSNVREGIKTAKFVFTDFRNESKLGTRILFMNQLLTLLTAFPFLLLMLFIVATQPLLFLASTLLGIFVYSSFPVFFYARRYNLRESLYAYTYSLFYTFSLFWITPYAIATAGKSGWLTRG